MLLISTVEGTYAKKLGISRPTLNRLENANQNVTFATLEQITKSLKCDIGDLFEWEVGRVEYK